MDTKTVKEFFESVAGDLDQMRATFYNTGVIDALAEHACVTSADAVVDVGCGTGFVAAGLAPHARQVIGVDDAPAMLAVAADNVATLGIENVALVDGAIDRLPLRARGIDAAVANMVLHHAEESATMLTEMARIVRPGVVAITDEVTHHYEWMRIEQADIWLGFTKRDVGGYFERAGLRRHGYARLGMQ
jgi:ArsR family transcriptional regulator